MFAFIVGMAVFVGLFGVYLDSDIRAAHALSDVAADIGASSETVAAASEVGDVAGSILGTGERLRDSLSRLRLRGRRLGRRVSSAVGCWRSNR